MVLGRIRSLFLVRPYQINNQVNIYTTVSKDIKAKNKSWTFIATSDASPVRIAVIFFHSRAEDSAAWSANPAYMLSHGRTR